MLHLHRIQRFNEFLRCKASGEILMYGDFYLTDDDGNVISYKYYHNMKEQKKREEWDNSILETHQSLKEYQDEMRKAEEEYLSSKILSEPIDTKDSYNWKIEEENS